MLLTVGILSAVAAAARAPSDAAASAARTWPPFVLVAGLLVLGAVAHADGVFAFAGSLLDRLPGGDTSLYFVAMGLVATITVFLNLDTSVAFLTPLLITLATRRGFNADRLLYGCVFVSNAASLLLPGSNLTNLLVVAGHRVSGAAFMARTWAPWVISVAVTTAGVALLAPRTRPGVLARPAPSSGTPPRPGFLAPAAIGVAIVLLLVAPAPALPVAAVGTALAAWRVGRRRLSPAELARSVDIPTLLGVFLLAVSLGTVAQSWSGPAHLMAQAGPGVSAALGVVASVLVNNLPAAVLLGSRLPAHPVALLIGLNIGPNLAVTGSLSAIVWWRAAATQGVRPSAWRYSALGAVLVPLAVAAAVAVRPVSGGGVWAR